MNTQAMTFSDVSFGYSGTSILKNLSLEIPRNRITVLFGPSGSGKTTILRLFSGFEIPQTGVIGILGETVSSPDCFIHPCRRNLSLVFQNLALWPHMTVLDQITFCSGDNAADTTEKRNHTLEMLSISHLTKRYPHQLSGGEKQRVALARAMAGNPKILLLDEPMASLGEPHKSDMADLLKQIAGQEITLLYVTHDLDMARHIGQHFLLLSNGKIMKTMNKSDFANLDHESLRKIFSPEMRCK
ncbi:MAG: hypothetical protein CVV64_10305 [Candidatus Wallbacteria bacterium HGW-Wallbacteria-1]|jgi:ABC-type Fe3+/spermidine/putrescine transport system ATPase subunit|uniref:ABC transporter domain-containing protein n=1 Tax=Candidatus Wallbacteria bacterium HGW-Wallbacteria-1 TaxID=2013854 RepID=A0A2N1PPS7_9BACT|nr:MAG: hypothetical protein CVV64_10305 [Candidatus Wallbacteria bacterium HGW-Wallbacteria-1]